jgi:hypothetical protein
LNNGMARSAWATMTRGGTTGFRSSDEPRVDARVKDLKEMAIGRTDDPETPLKPMVLEAAGLFGTGSRTPSGPAAMTPRRQGRTHDRSRTAVKILFEVLEPTGSFSNRGPPVNSLLLVSKRFGWSFRQLTQVRADTSRTTGHNAASTASSAASRY